jgi:hypothetical protein
MAIDGVKHRVIILPSPDKFEPNTLFSNTGAMQLLVLNLHNWHDTTHHQQDVTISKGYIHLCYPVHLVILAIWVIISVLNTHL